MIFKKIGWKQLTLMIAIILFIMRVFFVCVLDRIDTPLYYSTDEIIPKTTQVLVEDIHQQFKSNQKRLNRISFVFNDIPEDKQGHIVFKLLHGKELIYQSNLNLKDFENNAWKDVYINTPLIENQTYEIVLKAEACSSLPSMYVVDDDYSSELTNTLSSKPSFTGNALVRFGYLKEPSILDKLLNVFESAMYLFLYVLFIKKFDRIKKYCFNKINILKKLLEKDKSFSFVVASQILLSFYIFGASGIEFQIFTKIILLFLSLFSVYKLKEKISYVKNIFPSLKAKLCFSIVILYAAFALVGNRAFLYPLDKTVSVFDCLLYIVTIIWIIPLVITFIFYFFNIKIEKREAEKTRIKNILFYFVIICLLIIPAIYTLFAFNPGISSPDSTYCLTYAHAIYSMPNWHPPFYILLLKVVISIWDSTYAIIIVQYVFWLYVMLEMFALLRKRGIRDKILIVLAIFIGFNTANYLQINTIWKDVLYVLSLVWLTVIICKILLYQKDNKLHWFTYLELVISLVLVSSIRQNGIVPYILTVAMLIFFLKKNKKIIISVISSAILIFTIQYPIYSFLNVQEVKPGGKYIGLSQDILATYYSGGEISQDTMKMLTILSKYDISNMEYNPYFANSSYELNVSIGEFVKNYLDTFFKNPIIMLREMLIRQDVAWDIFPGMDAVESAINFSETQDGSVHIYNNRIGDWNSMYPKRVTNSYTTSITDINNYTVSNQFLKAIEWRSGLSTLLCIIILLTFISRIRDKIYALIFIPLVGQLLSLILSTGWSDFRYYWPINLITVFAIAIVPTFFQDSE